MKRRILLANGCSMTVGAEMAEDGRLHHCYAGHLSRYLNRELVNIAFSGSGHHRVLRTTLDWLAYHRHEDLDVVVVIGWGVPGRLEFTSERDPFFVGFNEDEIRMNQHFHPIMLTPMDHRDPHNNALRDMLVRYFHHEPSLVIQEVTHMISLQHVLKGLGVPFLFTHALPIRHALPPDYLVEMLDPQHWVQTGFGEQSFAEHARRADVPHGPYHHPLEEGHRLWFQHLIDNVDFSAWK